MVAIGVVWPLNKQNSPQVGFPKGADWKHQK